MHYSLIILLAFILSACTRPSDATENRPRLLQREMPAFPYDGTRNKIYGVINLTYDIDNEGRVLNIRILKATPDHSYDDAIINAMSRWRYEKGKPVTNASITVVIHPSVS